MIKFPFIILILICYYLNVFAKPEVYGGLGFGSVYADETFSGNKFAHSSGFFVGHFGFGIGGRYKFDFGRFSIGPVAELFWIGDTVDRKQDGVVNDSQYRYESSRLIGGLNLSYKFNALSVVAEYYPFVQNTVTYSDGDSVNPFRMNDKLKATGYGVGFMWEIGGGLNYTFIYRRLSYKDVEMAGTSTSLPSSRYSSFEFDDVLGGFTKEF